MSAYLQPTAFIDSQHPAIAEYCRQFGQGDNERQRVVNLYYAIRDDILYDPFTVSIAPESYKASNVLAAGRGWCVPKAILLAACCRHLGIAARLGFADVSNHLSTEKMRAIMKTDVFYWHGYTAIHLDGRWVKATPAFNLSLCQKFGLKPLEFNGRDDSLYHEFDQAGNRHMEYLNQRGEYADLPLAEMLADFQRYYPDMSQAIGLDFEREVAAETER